MNQDKSRQLEVLITSGGTISEIDDVRHIGNFSSGTTGAIIAEEFLRSGSRVNYLYSLGSKVPFKRSLNIRPDLEFEAESKRTRTVYNEYQKYKSSLTEYPVKNFDDYLNTLKSVLETKPVDVVVLAAAVSDYSAVKTVGKLSSDYEELTIKLKRNPKVISLVKTWRPEVYQVGFKLLVGVSEEELKNTAYNHMEKNNSDLIVANSLSPGGDFEKTQTFILTPNKESYKVSRSELAKKLVEVVSERYAREIR